MCIPRFGEQRPCLVAVFLLLLLGLVGVTGCADSPSAGPAGTQAAGEQDDEKEDAIAIKVFDWFSSDIQEWEEIKKGNWSVAMIFTALIVMIGILVYKVI